MTERMNIMKKHRINALFISALLALQTGGIQASALHTDTLTLHSARNETATLVEGVPRSRATISSGISENAKNAVLPASYDLRDHGLVTAVKNQWSYGTCWAFAALASLESTMVAEDPGVDLSEWILAYTTYCDEFGFPRTTGAESLFDEGGVYANTAAMLMSGVGSVAEDYMDYWYGNTDIEGCGYSADDWRAARSCQATDCITLPYWTFSDEFEEQKKAVKNAIYEGHALSVSYTHNDNLFNLQTNSYYYNYELEVDAQENFGHGVAIVGWDDNYPAENFLYEPESDGAWLCRNSWGVDWGDCGYFWMSYEDDGIWDIFYLESGSVSEYSDIVQYDDYGYWNSLCLDENGNGDTQVYAANVFTAEEDCYVTAAMLCTTMVDEDYEITVYSGLTDPNDPSSGTPSAVTSGHLSEAGYHTIDLAEPVFVAAGDSYAVTVKYSGEVGYHLACEGAYRSVTTYNDGSEEIYQNDQYDRIGNTRTQGQSFCSADGSIWTDLYEAGYTYEETTYENTPEEMEWYLEEWGKYPVTYFYEDINTNVCLKAFTQPADKVIFSEESGGIPIGTEITLSSRGGEEIWYSMNGGEAQLYSEPIVFTGEDMSLSAYTGSGSSEMCSAYYTREIPRLSSLLFIEPVLSGESIEDFRYYISEDKGVYEFPSYAETETLFVQPISTDIIRIDGQEVASGELVEIAVGGEAVTNVTLQVERNGVTADYIIRSKDTVDYRYGDADNNGVVNAVDAADVLIYAAEIGSGADPVLPDEYWLDRSDASFDGVVDALDAAEILLIAALEGSGDGAVG